MPFPPSAACRFFDLPPVNLQNLPLHLTKNSFASAPTHLCGIAYIFHHLLLRKNPRLLRKEAEGGGIAAISYCFVPFRHDQRTEPVWRLCDRPLETIARSLLQLRGARRWQVAAALSAAVTTTKQQGTASTLQAEPTQKNRPSRTPAALRERGSGGEALLSEKRPLPQRSPPQITRPVSSSRVRGWSARRSRRSEFGEPRGRDRPPASGL